MSVLFHLPSTVARCGKDGCKRTISASSRKSVPMYVCRDGHVTIPVHKVDMVVLAEMARGIGTVAMAGHFVVDEAAEVDTSGLDRLRERLDALAEPYADGAITLNQFMKATEALRKKIEAAEEAIAHGSISARSLSVEEAWEVYANASIDGKREFLRSGSDITIHPVGKGQRVDPLQQVEVRPRGVA